MQFYRLFTSFGSATTVEGVIWRRAPLDTATSPRPGLPLLLWRRGLGRGGRPVGKPLPPRSANPSMPLSPTPSPRSAGGEREESLGAVARWTPAETAPRRVFSLSSSGGEGWGGEGHRSR